jgi:hypothetical protein
VRAELRRIAQFACFTSTRAQILTQAAFFLFWQAVQSVVEAAGASGASGRLQHPQFWYYDIYLWIFGY